MPPSPGAAGWYRDPEDPARLRHYSGRVWDSRRRMLPPWVVGVEDFVVVDLTWREGDPRLEGPVRGAILPAIAAAGAQSLSPVDSRRPASGPGTSRGLGAAHDAVGDGGPPKSAGGVRPVRRALWSDPRTTFMVTSTLVALLVVILVATIGLANRPVADTTLSQDATFIRSANIACGEAMGAIRLQTPPTVAAPGMAPAMSRAAVAAANRGLLRLSARIAALPVVDTARSQIQGWLDAWNRYAIDRQHEADAGAAAAGARGAGSLSSTVSLDEAQADAFVATNGLGNCTLASTSLIPAS